MRPFDDEISRAIRGRTLLHHIVTTVEQHGDRVALRWLEGDRWCELTWREYLASAQRLAGSLAKLGFSRGDRALLMLKNQPRFHIADLGVMLQGGVAISVFNGSSREQARYVAEHSRATLAIVEDEAWGSHFIEAGRLADSLRSLILVNPGVLPDGAALFGDLLQGPAVDVHDAVERTQPEDILAVCYTSGTTGPPKGVTISHRAVCWWIESLSRGFAPRTIQSTISYLPMTTMLERLVSHYAPMALATEVTTCPDPTAIGTYLRSVRPQFFAGVPLVWDRLRSAIRSVLASSDSAEASTSALEIGRRWALLHAEGRAGLFELEDAYACADAEVLSKLRTLVGLDRCQLAVIGAAPIPPDLAEFFLALGVPLSGSYGLTECTGVVNQFGARRPGYVGHPTPGCDLRLEADGEILLRSGCMFSGYLDDPDATRAVLDADGWLHTGDIGQLHDCGGLRIIDRKKELIVRPSGRNISPAALESRLTSDPWIDHACVFGEGRAHLGAILVVNPLRARGWAKEAGLEHLSNDELAEDPSMHEHIGTIVERINGSVSEEERIGAFALRCELWGPLTGELTPTLKLKRRTVLGRYRGLIELLYGERELDDIELSAASIGGRNWGSVHPETPKSTRV